MSLRERKKRETLAAIRQAAARLFAERGYGDTRTRDIAREAGIATGTLFNYAPTKEAVVLIVWKQLAADAVASGFAAADDADDPVDALVAVFTPIFALYGQDLELGRVFLTTVMFEQDAGDAELQALNEGFIGQLATLLAPSAGAEALPAALSVFSAYYAVLTMLLAGRLPDEPSALHLFRQLLRVQQRGWSPGGGP